MQAADLFCGAGGTSTGLLMAARELGMKIDLVAINHWELAIKDWRKMSKSSTAQNGKGRVECLWLSPNIKTTLF